MEILLHPLFVGIMGAICGYFFKNIPLYIISGLAIAFIVYNVFNPLEELAFVITLLFIADGFIFLGAMWLVAIIARWKQIAPYLIRIKDKVVR